MPSRKCWMKSLLVYFLSFLCFFGIIKLWTHHLLRHHHETNKRSFLTVRDYPRGRVSSNTSGELLKPHGFKRVDLQEKDNNPLSSSENSGFFREPKSKVKLIMDFNPRPSTRHIFRFTQCQYSACAMTSDPTEADLLMVNALQMEGQSLPPRPLGQIRLMYTREPPTSKRLMEWKRSDLKNQINWTLTIFNDSTFPVLYGVLKERPEPDKDYDAIFRRKKYEAAWFVSRCEAPSQRELYVRRMSQYVSVHLYGPCGNRTCGSKGYTMGGSKANCLKLLSDSYKFYLSFENSFCRDYITEKFFNMFTNIGVIPVVRGGGDYKRLFPSGTFINSEDFPSPESLANYLSRLSRDRSAYTRMLKNKNRFVTEHASTFNCDLCKALHLEAPRQLYGDVYSWMLRMGNCWDPTDLRSSSV